jgi:hypothetical protein
MPSLRATEVVQGSEATFAQHGAMSGLSSRMLSCIIAELTLADSSAVSSKFVAMAERA